MMGTVEQDLARYEREQDRLSSEEDWLSDEVTRLMKEDLNPDNAALFIKTLGEINAKAQEEIQLALSSKPFSYEFLGRCCYFAVYDRLEEKACEQAQENLMRFKEDALLARQEDAACLRDPGFDWSPASW